MWQAPPCPPRRHARRKARSMIDSPRTRVDERRSARGCDRWRGQQVVKEEQGEGQEDKRDVRRWRKRWCAHDVKHPRGRAIVTARVGVGMVSDEYREEAHAPMPSAENGVARRWRHEGREKRSRMENEVVATEAGTIIIVGGIDGQMDRVWRTGPRHDAFNSDWANPA
jgi:hypothetical protein